MRAILILILIFLVGCSSAPPVRRPASLGPVVVNSEIDITQSKVQIFPAVADENGLWYYFYLHLKNAQGQFIDSDEIELKTNQGESVPFQLERSRTGRYYMTLRKSAGVSSAHMNLFIQGKPLREEFKLNFDYPNIKKSKIVLVEQDDERNVFRLHLQNEHGEHISSNEKPEIHLEGLGIVEDPHQVSEGVWEFSVIYPEQNTIMYLSVRAMGVFLPKLFRYQHIEK